MSGPGATDGPSARLAAFASTVAFESIPAAAVARVKLCVLDALGCGLFATRLPWGRILTEFVVQMGGTAEAGLWGTRHRAPAANAALVNGTLVHAFELDDLHKTSILHPSSTALPAALAIAEARGGFSGRDLITAIVAGFEVGIRAGVSLGTSHLVDGFHPTGTIGTVAAAAAAGRALGLSARAMEHAISVGATQAAGLMAAQYESMVKRMHAGRAAQAGVYGALLAEKGFTGIDGVFEADYGGFCSTLTSEPRLAALTDGLGTRFETEKVGFKIYACCGSCHTSVEAIRRLRHAHGIDADAVESIVVHTSKATQLHVGWPYEPRSITAAQMNLPYCAAVTLIDGNAFVEQFTEQRIHDARVIDLARRVEVRHAPEFDAMGPTARHRVRVELALRGGRRLDETVQHAKGSDADPLSHDEVVAKFHRLAGPIIGRGPAQELHDVVMALDAVASLAPLTALLSTQHSDMKTTGERKAHA